MPTTIIATDASRTTQMPPEVRDIYDRELWAARTRGMSEAEAIQYAIRMVQHAGWYVTADGWKRLAPDVRNKINVRFAQKQPNGRYLVGDVDVFYPNAVKIDGEGNAVQFTPRDTNAIVANTNRMVSAGGQKPAVTRAHITRETKANGVKENAMGEAINFRPSPRGDGWIRCDLADLAPSLVDEWRNRKATGLSAAFVGDGGGLNRRIGHVAVLSEAQALAALPATEIFSVQDQLCFSADEAAFINRNRAHERNVPMPKSKEFCGRMKQAFSALSAAYAAMEAGEEGADAKLDEARGGYSAACKDFAAEADAEHPDAAEDEALFKKLMEEQKEGEGDTLKSGEGNDSLAGGGNDDEPQYSADEIEGMDDATFAASVAQHPIAVMNAMRKRNAALQKQVREDAAGKARREFESFCAEHNDLAFDAGEAIADFDAASGNAAMIDRIKARVLKSPKRAKGPADVEQVFSYEDYLPGTAAAKAKGNSDTKPRMLDGSSMNFSADDVNAAYAAADVFCK